MAALKRSALGRGLDALITFIASPFPAGGVP